MAMQSTTQPHVMTAASHPALLLHATQPYRRFPVSSTLPITLIKNPPPEHSLARFTGLLGLITFLALAYAMSTNRRAIRWRTVLWGLGLQVVFAFLVIKWTFGQSILFAVSRFITG